MIDLFCVLLIFVLSICFSLYKVSLGVDEGFSEKNVKVYSVRCEFNCTERRIIPFSQVKQNYKVLHGHYIY